MFDLKSIIPQICNGYEAIKIKEDFDTVNMKIQTSSPTTINNDSITKVTNSLSANTYITLFYNDFIADCQINKEDSVLEYNETLKDYLEDDDFDCYELRVSINKQKDNIPGHIVIYNLTAFIDFLKCLSLSEILNLINSKCTMDSSPIYFDVLDEELDLTTTKFVFRNAPTDSPNQPFNNRELIIEKSHYLINKNGDNIYTLLPNDFYIKKPSSNQILNDLFNEICIKLCFIYMANYSDFSGDILKCKIFGYKSIDLNFSKVAGQKISRNALDSYFNIYTWIYEGMNVSDKCGIARNILSLYLNNSNLWDIQEDLYSFVLSCEEIYLKENINKYIEVKGNVFNLLNELNVKLIDMSSSFSSKIRNNILAMITFCFTTLLLTVISNGKIENIFTKDIATLSYAFMFGSLIYFAITLYDFYKDKKRYINFYNRQKAFYSDVLCDKDLDTIFMQNRPFEEDIKDINFVRLRYTIFWIAFIVVAYFVVRGLSGYSLFSIVKLLAQLN